ncbi:MAG: sigma-54-dependent transcriptional regulator [Hyphomicrobiales bacterium]
MPNDLGYIALIEDDLIMGESLQRALELEGWRTAWWHSGTDALSALPDAAPDLVLCDIRLPDMNGEEVFRRAHAHRAAPPFLFMTAFGQIDQAVALVRAGAVDYLTKPFDVPTLLERARWIVRHRGLNREDGVLGTSQAMRNVETLLQRIALRQSSLLVVGETGVGKEVCARYLHRIGAAGEPFMAVNCAAIPSELLESELFGHEKGAFSGAHQRHLGYAERARGGILFLDEIAEMPLSLQAKLLRVIEDRSFHRVGGETLIPLKARLVCASNRNLDAEVKAGRFREDLLYRVNVVSVEIPPLRARIDDIPWLLSRFFETYAADENCAAKGISTLAEEACIAHDWPGNARELRNRVERAAALALGDWLMPADLFPELRDRVIDGVAEILPLAAVRNAAERRQIERALKETGGQIGEAARRLDISRTTLWEKMRRLGVTADV